MFQLVPHGQLEEDELEGNDEIEGIDEDDLDALRRAALEAPTDGESASDARRRGYRRSRAVRRYVLARAKGDCEGCETPAPFVRVDGTPYLEPHHRDMAGRAGVAAVGDDSDTTPRPHG